MIELQSFSSVFGIAVKRCVSTAQHFVNETLPNESRFTFSAARHWVGADGKVKFLGGRILAPDRLVLQPFHIACRYMWVDGKVPIWINLCVSQIESNITTIEIMLSKQLCGEVQGLMHHREGYPPFHILGPRLPHGWKSIEESGRFPLEWWRS